MPLYQYKCPACGTTTDRQRSIEDRDCGPVCSCGPDVMVRQWGIAGVVIR